MHKKILFAAGSLLTLALAGCASPPPIDHTLFTQYEWGERSISLSVCGHLNDGNGCFGMGGLGRFKHPCSLLEGKSTINGNVVSRDLYVIDGQKSDTAPIELDVFQRTDEINGSKDNVQVPLIQKIPLGILGGTSAQCFMAANDTTIYAGTSVSTEAVSIDKKNFAVTHITSPDEPQKLTGIMADERGDVMIKFEHSERLRNSDHVLEFDGHGSQTILINTLNAQEPP